MEFENPVIVGGGISGLALADIWSARGRSFTLVEREPALGGLARSIEVGDQTFDLGPHRFFTHDDEILSYILDVLGDNADWIERQTSVYLFDSYHEWPLTRNILRSMPWKEIIRVGIDLLLRSRRPVNNFEDFIINRYGPTLLRIFFKPITEKFFRMPCKLVHPDWARVSVDRAIIDKHPHIGTLSYLFSRLFRSRQPLRFIYPHQGGIQAFASALEQRIRTRGTARIIAGERVQAVEAKGGRVNELLLSSGERLQPDLVIWTPPLTVLWELISGEQSELSFLSTIFYYFILKAPADRKDQWIYVPEEDFCISRVSYPNNFKSRSEGPAAVCAEVTALPDESFHREPERLFPKVIADLSRLGILSGEEDIKARAFVVAPESYPVYSASYTEKLGQMILRLGKISNLHLLGRCGLFWYNNMDNCIKAAIELDRWLSGREEPPGAAEKSEWISRARDRY